MWGRGGACPASVARTRGGAGKFSLDLSVFVVVEIFPQGERGAVTALEGSVIASTVSGGEFPHMWSVDGYSGLLGLISGRYASGF